MRIWTKLFSTPFSFYAYDVNLNQLIEISEDLYFELKEIINNTYSTENISEELRELRENGYFNEPVVKGIKNELTDMNKLKLEKAIKTICLQITQNCNFRCDYCVYSENVNKQQRSHSPKKMSFDTAKKSIDFLLNHTVGTENPNIAFYGGEPLLEFDLIKKIIHYAENTFKGKKIKFNITTNGSLLTIDKAKYLYEHNVVTMISLDGPKNIHDKYRLLAEGNIGSFDIIRKNIEKIKEELPGFYKQLTIHSVINSECDLEEINLIKKDKLFNEINFRYSLVDFTFDSNKKKQINKKFVTDYEYSMFLSQLYNLGFVKKNFRKNILDYPYEVLQNMIANLNEFPAQQLSEFSFPGGQCLPGEAKLFVDYKGTLYPCEKVCESEDMQIGNIYDGFNHKKIEKILKFCELTEEQCKNCFAFQLCSTCIYKCTDNGILSKEKRLNCCNESRKGVEQYLRLKIQNYEMLKYMKKVKDRNEKL